ncbi:geranylgeranyl transferas-like protein type II beta subunit [Trichodelitschia bisporula]|uniref:Geranylgeranyl transferase type-2 subunit beta n=1 Tax=Trichodelitschia bisporula TaxID=703511 RepID=A0A6G1HIP4_9PEZI|nr:geranylgeranyl transferas-like protein type II beta subunit [Trichodelitschia bisporula]
MSLVAGPGRGGALSSAPSPQQLHTSAHVRYTQTLDKRHDEFEYWLTEHLRLNGLYWGLTALHLLGKPDALPRAEVLDFVLSCLHESGGMGAAPGHDAHMLYTVSGVQILALVDGFEELEARVPGGKEKIANSYCGLQDPATGTFFGDQYGEPDTRFLYGALNALSLLGRLDLVDVPRAVTYIESCANPDGGYGNSPGAESHSGQIFTYLAALSIADRLDTVDTEHLAGWLSERQVSVGESKGGLNGRPEKKEDVCYSWWVLSSLAMLNRVHWIDGKALESFILRCQDPEHGGISDRPGDMVDVFHTVFGLAGLSILKFPGLEEVDPVYCLPRSVTRKVLGK